MTQQQIINDGHSQTLVSIAGYFNLDHPSFEDEFDALQKIAGVTIYEIKTVSYPVPDVMYILFKRDFTPFITGERVLESEVDAFIEQINAFESFELTGARKEVLPLGLIPYCIAGILSLPHISGEQDVREGQRIHQPQFTDGDFSDVEVTRENVLIEEVLERIDEAIAENSKK